MKKKEMIGRLDKVSKQLGLEESGDAIYKMIKENWTCDSTSLKEMRKNGGAFIVIPSGFVWRDTDQGQAYWSKIANLFEKGL